ncbi:PUA domain-containing protein [Natronorarus salvus]|uniref:PUA domain-containing protein n=1 Tax=Natronorarus salvus TaxID=3117733 RepID=UPI002F25F76F
MTDEPFEEVPRLRRIADYQFGTGAGEALFSGELSVTRSSSGRPVQVIAPEGRLVTFGQDGRFTLGIAGGERLRSALSHPRYRVVVNEESEPFVRDGKNAFSKFVLETDPEIRGGDEVLVVNDSDSLLAVGRAELDSRAIADFETGMAVKVREGAD